MLVLASIHTPLGILAITSTVDTDRIMALRT